MCSEVIHQLSLLDEALKGIVMLEGYGPSSNCYFIDEGNGNYLQVDTGNSRADYVFLDEYGIKPRNIDRVFLTHSHYDHVGGLLELLRYESFKSAKVLVNPDEASSGQLKLLAAFDRSIIEMAYVKDGDKISAGAFDLMIIFTPGHTGGHTSLYDPKRKILFCGDLASTAGLLDLDPVTGSYRLLSHSLKRILSTFKTRTLLPGHGFIAVEDGENFLQATHDKIVEAVAPSDLPAIERTRMLSRVGLLEEALEIARRLVSEQPTSGDAWFMMGSVMQESGMLVEALHAFDSALAQGAMSSELLVRKAMTLLELEKYDKAFDAFQEVLKIDPDSDDAKLGRDMSLYGLGKGGRLRESEK